MRVCILVLIIIYINLLNFHFNSGKACIRLRIFHWHCASTSRALGMPGHGSPPNLLYDWGTEHFLFPIHSCRKINKGLNKFIKKPNVHNSRANTLWISLINFSSQIKIFNSLNVQLISLKN